MNWFVILLSIHFGLGVLFKLAELGGWRLKKVSQFGLGLAVLIWGFFFVGVFLWI